MPGDETESYTIQQLAEKAGVSVRTIRFYINEGLLAAPPVRGRYTVYNDEYLDRLELIRRLKESFLPLKEIRDRVTSLTWAQVKQALAQPDQPPLRKVSERGEAALSYINRLLSPAAAPRVDASMPPPPASPTPAARPETWERISLAPGIELHIRSGASPSHQRLVRQLIETAKKLFNVP